ncbi:putative F-box/LRR-repeat/kelch-repeat protein At1g11620 [Silene latifolia]|uniref:putative F-box/LRR-repeat/kelch-repeat protein At1g11620 n=1 Tax=Silene latifolia TaxID=37657 RepID=UPI003D77954C
MKNRMKPKTLSNLQQKSSNIHQHLPESKYLPPELCTQIFVNLPAKTLLRFRCVCKSWSSIIDDPDFVNMHFKTSQITSRNNNNLLVDLEGLIRNTGYMLTVCEAETLRKTDLIFSKSTSYTYQIIGSCNGLFLVERFCRPYYRKELRLWNPCIRKSLPLPVSPFGSLVGTKYLFGFASHSQDYKVVAMTFDDIEAGLTGKTYVAVYTLSDQKWTVRNDQFDITFPNNISIIKPFDSLSTAVFCRGSAYWLGYFDKPRNYFHKPRNTLTHLGSFDFDKEKTTFLELPFTWDENGSLRFLFLLGGSLAVFSISKLSSRIWMLEQDNEKEPWTLWFLGESSWDGYQVFFSFLSPNQKVIYCESDGGYFICGNKVYNIASRQVRVLNRSMSSNVRLDMYSESLVLSKGNGTQDLRSFP